MSKPVKKMNKKYLLIIGGVFLAVILIIVIVALVRSCSGPSDNYEKVEEKMMKAAEKYFTTDNRSLPEETSSKEVTTSELASAGVMKELTEYLTDASCSGKVTVYNNGGQMLYVPDLDCTEYKTVHLVDKIKEDNLIESSEDPYQSGLYVMDDKYVFRGKKPNNYLLFGGITWRIIDIDSNGLIRVIKAEAEKHNIYWDTKYNAEAKKSYGINDYKNSYILETMNTSYENFKDTSKAHLAPFSVCIGKRASQDLDIDYSIDCSETLDNQYIGLVSVSDYSRASLDTGCTSITEQSCLNYNYMVSILNNSWTSSSKSDNTYDVIYIGSGKAASMQARSSASYNWVVSFNGNEKYITGDGTEENPYQIGTTEKN